MKDGRALSLPGDVKEGMERAIGRDFSKVKFVESPIALEMGESAYTQGDTLIIHKDRLSYQGIPLVRPE